MRRLIKVAETLDQISQKPNLIIINVLLYSCFEGHNNKNTRHFWKSCIAVTTYSLVCSPASR